MNNNEQMIESLLKQAYSILDEVFNSEKNPNKDYFYTVADWWLEEEDETPPTLVIEGSFQVGVLFGKAYQMGGCVFFKQGYDMLLELYDHNMVLPTRIYQHKHDKKYYWDTDMAWETE